ncbi:hypothetical protein ANCDUO_26382 [Ancylostoma duodenale]|uniref:Uncharacterized protein n=1 Tax=Ancylostoma duodenale TaxID=51022 RepID=A0A0C2BIJ0_9BILA|nr:hypothetical protein ANCDUO_26382 [Ancylostoma duodenale]
MQGLHSFGGSISQLVAPIVTTFSIRRYTNFQNYLRYLFQHSGYQYVMVLQICILCFAFMLVIGFYKRLVPLQMKPAPGKSAKYKNGVFYTM